jgi:hypothetical protein
LHLQFKFVAPLTQILSSHKSLFYNVATWSLNVQCANDK